MSNNKFSDGINFMGGAMLATIAGVLVLLSLFLGCAGLLWWHTWSTAQVELARERELAELAARQKRLEAERAAQEDSRAEKEAQRRRYEQESQARRAREAAEAEIIRKRLEAEKAKAEAERVRILVEARRAADEKAAQTRAAQERAASEAAERERRRREAEEFRRPILITPTELWRKGAALKGRTVILEAAALCKVFAGGNMIVTFSDSDKSGRVLVRGNVDKVDTKWNLDRGANPGVKLKLQGIVAGVDSGVVLLTACEVLGLSWKINPGF